MKVFLTIIISMFFSIANYGQIKFWENLSCEEKTNILNVCESELIKTFYEGHFVLSDDEKTVGLLNDLITVNDSTLPLSFYLLNKICTQSDGALAETVSSSCIQFVAMRPIYFLSYFSNNREISKQKQLFETYAMFIGSELYYKRIGTSNIKYDYKNLKEIFNSASESNNDIKETFNEFWKLVDKYIKNME